MFTNKQKTFMLLWYLGYFGGWKDLENKALTKVLVDTRLFRLFKENPPLLNPPDMKNPVFEIACSLFLES